MNEVWLWVWRLFLLLFVMSIDGRLYSLLRREDQR